MRDFLNPEIKYKKGLNSLFTLNKNMILMSATYGESDS